MRRSDGAYLCLGARELSSGRGRIPDGCRERLDRRTSFNALVQLQWRCMRTRARAHMHVCVHVCAYVYVPAQMRIVGLMVCMHHSLAAFACTVSGVQAACHLAVHFKVVTEVFGLFILFCFLGI